MYEIILAIKWQVICSLEAYRVLYSNTAVSRVISNCLQQNGELIHDT